MDRNLAAPCELDRSQHQDPCAGRRHLQHLLVRHLRQLARLRHDPGVGGEDARDVRVDLARRAEGRRQGDGGRVGPPPAERGHVHRVSREALEACDEDDLPVVEGAQDPDGRDLPDLRLRVDGVGEDPCLRPGEGDGFLAEVVNRHRDEGAGDALAGGEEHVELARVWARRHAPGELEERVRGAPHRRHGPDDTKPALARRDKSLRDVADLLGLGDRRAAELHDDGVELGVRLGLHTEDCGRSDR